MAYKFVLLYLATYALTLATGAKISKIAENEYLDADGSESKFLTSSDHEGFFDSLGDDYHPYEPAHNFAAPQASLGVSVNSHAVLAPKLEVLRLVEAFIKLKAELIARFQALVNDNFELIRSVFNLILNKTGTLHVFTLKGISVLRKILEFALNLFADWNITLPSLTVGASVGNYGEPYPSYGVPPSLHAHKYFGINKS